MTQKGNVFKPTLKKGDFRGHVIIDLGYREEHTFSRQAADEVVSEAFTDGKISGPDFSRLLAEIEVSSFFKKIPEETNMNGVDVVDVIVDAFRPEPLLNIVQSMAKTKFKTKEPALA